MAINRAPFNALVDDDGSNLVGSVWNKAAIAGVVLDPVDAAIAAGTAWTLVETTAQVPADWDPGIVGHTIIVSSPATNFNITGFKPALPPQVGQRLLFINQLGRAIQFYMAHANSTAGARILGRATSATSFTLTVPQSFAEFVYVTIGGVGGWFVTAVGNTALPAIDQT